MDSKILREAAISYLAVYDQNLRERLEDRKNFENWVNSLIDEGYDLSDYTWEEMYETYVDEARDGYGDDSKFKQDTDAKKFRPGVDVPKVKKFGRISRAMPPQISGHATKTISANTRTRGEDPGAPRSQKIAKDARNPRLSREIIRHPKPQAEEYDVYEGKLPLDQARRTRIGTQIGRRTASAEHDYEGSKVEFMPKSGRDKLRKSAAKKVGEVKKMMGALKSAQKNEEYDVYDLILSHLLDEGYASSVKSAEAIMANMSQEWITSIID